MILLPISALHSLRKEDGSYEKNRAQGALSDDVSGLPGHRNYRSASKDAGHQQTPSLSADRRRFHPGILIGNTYKIPKAGVINYVMTEGGEKYADSKN